MTDTSATPDTYTARQRLPFAMVPRGLVECPDADPYVIAVYTALSARSNKQDRTWPSYDLLVKESHQSRARLAKSLQWLETAGWVTIHRGADEQGHRIANVYVLHEEPALSSRDELGPEFTSEAPEFTGQSMSGILEQEPSELEPVNKNHSASVAAEGSVEIVVDGRTQAKSRSERDELWDALSDLFGEPTAPQRKLQGLFVSELVEYGATPDEIRHRSAGLVAEWGGKANTLASLRKWWTRTDGQAGQVSEADADELRRRIDRQRFRELMAEREANPPVISEAQRKAKERYG